MNQYTGTKLIDTATRLAWHEFTGWRRDILKQMITEIYQDMEYFDGEPTSPETLVKILRSKVDKRDRNGDVL